MHAPMLERSWSIPCAVEVPSTRAVWNCVSGCNRRESQEHYVPRRITTVGFYRRDSRRGVRGDEIRRNAISWSLGDIRRCRSRGGIVYSAVVCGEVVRAGGGVVVVAARVVDVDRRRDAVSWRGRGMGRERGCERVESMCRYVDSLSACSGEGGGGWDGREVRSRPSAWARLGPFKRVRTGVRLTP